MNAAITKAISETGANSVKQMGAVVKAAKAALEGKTVDGKGAERSGARPSFETWLGFVEFLPVHLEPRTVLLSLCPAGTIAMRFTEEDAGYVTVRPVIRQVFRLAELVDMVLSVTGKNALRVQQIFRAGTVVYNGFRYSWEGFASEANELAELLAPFPEDDLRALSTLPK